MSSCPSCGHASPSRNTFCGNCGKPLSPKSDNKTILYIIVGVLSLSALLCVTAIFTYRPTPIVAPKQIASASPTATPTPPPTEAEKFADAKGRVQKFSSPHQIQEGLDYLKQIPKGAAEFKEAQQLLRAGEKIYREALAEEKKVEQERKTQEAEAAIIGTQPTLRAWDGGVDCVDKYLKNVLNDYDSSEYVEWSPVTKIKVKGQPYWAVRLRLRATNAFGGKIMKDTYYFIRHDRVVYSEGLGG
jgi:hypothetical protein